MLPAIIGVWVACFGVAAHSESLNTGEATELIEQLGTETLGLLTDKEMARDEQQREVRRLLKKGFAVNTISRFVLGRYWRVSTETQQTEYQSLFVEYVIDYLVANLGRYSGQTFQVVSERTDGPRGAIVESRVNSPDGAPVTVHWRVRGTNNGPKIVDVVVEGVSLALTQRAEFASVIQRKGGSVDGLIEELKIKLDELRSQ